MKNEHVISILLRFISGSMLILALGNHPSSYYSLLRWIVAGSCLYSGYVVSTFKKSNWAWILFIVGILFNPIFPIYLNRSTWQIIDMVTAIILFVSLSVDNKYYG